MLKEVTKKYKIVGMAYSREEFKNKVEEKVGGALYEYLKAAYTKENGETKWVAHWTSEVSRLLNTELVVVLLHTATFKNKEKAAKEVLDSLHKLADNYKKSAKKQLETSYFKKTFKKEIGEARVETFFTRVQKLITDHI